MGFLDWMRETWNSTSPSDQTKFKFIFGDWSGSPLVKAAQGGVFRGFGSNNVDITPDGVYLPRRGNGAKLPAVRQPYVPGGGAKLPAVKGDSNSVRRMPLVIREPAANDTNVTTPRVPLRQMAPNRFLPGAATDPIAEMLAALQAQIVDPAQAASMAAAEYGPQLEAIAAMQDAARERTTLSQQAVGDLYGALANTIRAEEAAVGGNYDQAAAAINTAYDTAGQDVAQNYDASAAEMEAMMRRLGLEEAAPSALLPGAEARAQQTSQLDQMQANEATNQQSQKANALAFNTAQAQNAGFAGANAQADLTRQLNQVLADYDIQKLGLQGAQAQRENDLFMGLGNQRFQQQMGVAGLMQELAAIEAQQNAAAAEQAAKARQSQEPNLDDLDPYSRIEYQVAQRTNPEVAQRVVDFVRDQASTLDLRDQMGNVLPPHEIARLIRAQNRQGSGIPSHEIDAAVIALARAGYFG